MSKAKRLLAVMCSMALLLSGAVWTDHAVLAEEVEENLIPTEEVMSMEETSGQEEDVPAAETRVEENVSEVKQIAPEPEPAVAEEPVKQPSATEKAPAEVPAEDQKAPETTEPTAGAETAAAEEEQEASKDVPSGEAEETSEEEPAGENQPEVQPAAEAEIVIPNEDQAAVPEQEKPEGTTLVSETTSDPVVQVTEPKEIPVVEVDGVSADILIGSETTMVVLKSSAAGTVLVTLNKVPGLVLKGEDKKEVSPVGNTDPDVLSYELKVRFGETEFFLSASTEATVNIQASLQKDPAQSETKQTSVEKEKSPAVNAAEKEIDLPADKQENETEVVEVAETEKAPAEKNSDGADENGAPSVTVIEMKTASDNEEPAAVEDVNALPVIETQQAPGKTENIEKDDSIVETETAQVDETDMVSSGVDEPAGSEFEEMAEDAAEEPDDAMTEENPEETAEESDTESEEEKSDEPTEEVPTEDGVETEADPTEEIPEDVTLTLISTLDGVEEVEDGTVIYMEAVLTGMDPANVLAVTWMYSEDDGETFHIIEDAHEMTYSYVVTTENVHNLWRVEIEI